jgi:hypothetical protein
MQITHFEAFVLQAPDTGRPHWVSNFIVPRANEVLVRLRTDAGIEGIGMATSYSSVEPATPWPPSACINGCSHSLLSGLPTRKGGGANR